MRWLRRYLYAGMALLAAGSLLVTLALQYPLSTPWPMGNDAAVYIAVARRILAGFAQPSDLLSLFTRESLYPLSHVLFAMTALVPLDWPLRFIWWTAAGQVAVGLALGWLAWRTGGWRAAAAGMVFWAITPVGVLRHFEDGTSAQLWSLAFLLLCFERILARDRWSALVLGMATFLSHALSGLVLVAVLGTLLSVVVISSQAWRRWPRQFWVVPLALLVLGVLFVWRLSGAVDLGGGQSSVALGHYFDSRLAPALLLVPWGVAAYVERGGRPFERLLLPFFLLISVLLAFNDQLGVGVWPGRLHSYAVVAAVWAAAVAWPHVLRRAVPVPAVRILLALALVAALGTSAWFGSQHVYAWYRNPDNYSRLHPDEIAAIEWLDLYGSDSKLILSKRYQRHAEWIPALSRHYWRPLEEDNPLLVSATSDEYAAAIGENLGFYVLFFLHQDEVPDHFYQRPDRFRLAYENDSAVIFYLVP